tara:strand:- start:1028 stop:1675 length:648 start_codon:yes stop_codon:yes gene_type:complete
MAKIIAIDGPASVGKSTLAKIISRKFNSPILFSGKLYRAVALETIKRRISHQNIKEILKCVSYINLTKLNSNELFSSEVDNISSIISANKDLRDRLTKFQRYFPKINDVKNRKFVIIEGRDIGTIVFPKADYKIFLWADAKVRAKRRYEQIKKNVKKVSYNKVYNDINSRDRKDLTRKIAPLMPAANSVLLDTSYIDIEQTFNAVKKIILKTKAL